MAESAYIGASFSNYQGNAALGGANGEALKFDLQPLNQLTAYVNLQNKMFWEQKQKNADKVVDKLASVADLDVNMLYGKDRDAMIKSKSTLDAEIAEALREVPSSDPAAYVRWFSDAQNKIGKVAGEYATKKQRTLSRAAQIEEINKKYPNDPNSRDIALKQLDEQFNSTDGRLESIPLWSPVALPQIPISKSTFDVYNVGKGNMDIKSTAIVFNPKQGYGVANQFMMFGAQKENLYPPEKIKDTNGKEVDNPAYKNRVKGKTADEIAFIKMQNANPEEVRQVFGKSADEFKNIVSKYYDANGTFDEDKFLQENSGNEIILGNYRSLKNLSVYSQDHDAQLNGGIFQSNGLEYKLPEGHEKDMFKAGIISDYRNIDARNLINAQQFAEYEGDKVVNKDIKTDSKENRLNREAANFRALLPYKRLTKAQEAVEKRIKAGGGTGKETSMILQPSIFFRDHVKGLKEVFDNPDEGKVVSSLTVKVNAIDRDTRNAMGITDDDITGKKVKQVKYFPDGSYRIIYTNGAAPRIGTIEQLKQGFIDAVRGGENNTPGFQEKAEAAFDDMSGGEIWNNWEGNGQSQSNEGSTGLPEGTTEDFKSAGWTDKQINTALKAGKIKIK